MTPTVVAAAVAPTGSGERKGDALFPYAPSEIGFGEQREQSGP